MAAIHTGFTTVFGGASAGPRSPFPAEWPNDTTPTAGDVLVCAVIGWPEDEDALHAIQIGTTSGDSWDFICWEMAEGDRPFALVVAWDRYEDGDGIPYVTPGAGWISGSRRWRAIVGGYRGIVDGPDIIATETDDLPSTPYTPPQLYPNRDTAVVTITAQATTELGVADGEDFTLAANWGGPSATGGWRRSLWLHDLEAYNFPSPVMPSLDVRDTAIPTASGQLCAVTFNLPIALFPPTPSGGWVAGAVGAIT